MWKLWLLSKTWRQRPSEFVAITDPWAAYCFDEAVFTWGQHVETEMSEAQDSVEEVGQKMHMRKMTLASLLKGSSNTSETTTDAVAPRQSPGLYRDPAQRV